MMSSYYFWFFIFAVVAYLIVTDNSVATAFFLVFKITQNWFIKRKWMLLNDPRNPIIKYLMWRRAYKLAKEIQDELKSDAK